MNIARAIREALPICIIPIAISLLITMFFTLLNGFFLGLPALSLPSSEAVLGTFVKIRSIDDGKNRDNFKLITINRQQLLIAYEVSPTLSKLKPLIEKKLATRITSRGGKDTGVELPIDWVQWSIIAAANQITDTNNRRTYQLFEKINYELETAFQKQHLKRKAFSVNEIDLGYWLPRFKQSLTTTTGYLVFPRVSERFLQNTDDKRVTPEMESVFNRVAHRRTHLINQKNLNKNLIAYLKRLTPLIHLINILGIISFIALFVYYLATPIHSSLLNQYILIISFALSMIILRLFLYTVVDTAFFPAPSRYLFPSNSLLSALSLLNLYVTVQLLYSKIPRNRQSS
jgi:GGDEF domain-containing protein